MAPRNSGPWEGVFEGMSRRCCGDIARRLHSCRRPCRLRERNQRKSAPAPRIHFSSTVFLQKQGRDMQQEILGGGSSRRVIFRNSCGYRSELAPLSSLSRKSTRFFTPWDESPGRFCRKRRVALAAKMVALWDFYLIKIKRQNVSWPRSALALSPPAVESLSTCDRILNTSPRTQYDSYAL